MERFKSLLQRIQDIYYGKHQKSAIDIDLMLDYTRVMYADLLEWRKEFSDPMHSDLLPVTEDHKEAPIKETQSDPVKEEEQKSPEENTINTTSQEPESSTPEQPATEEPPTAAAQPEVVEVAHQEDTPQQETPEVLSSFPEKENIVTLSQEHTGISFEPPFHLEKPVVMANTIVEEAPSETTFIEEMPAPTPAEIPLPEFKPYEPAKLFDNIIEKKDIRTSIGINDKYLFLNELFNNHKSDYEETMDVLNQFSGLEEARSWTKNNVAAVKHWDNEDQTVQGFYALLGKHFSSK